MTRLGTSMWVCAIAAVLVAALSVFMLERQSAGLVTQNIRIGTTPVTIWRADDTATGPPVLIAHGYAGSRQMMRSLSITLADAGFIVAAFDFQGHGRHPTPMGPDVTSLQGTTAQLVDQTRDIARAVRVLPGVDGPISLVGHSMATDVVIRAAKEIDNVAGVVAISMYSDAVGPRAPQRLLIVSGAFEGRLRGVALDRLRQVDPDADEGRTVTADGIARRAVAAPMVGHVGVLYSAATLDETRRWLAGAAGLPVRDAGLPIVGPWLLALLVALVVLAWPLAGLLGPPQTSPPAGAASAFVPLAAPILPALAAAALLPGSAFGLSAFGALAAFFGVWGVIQLAVLWRAGVRPPPVVASGIVLLLVWGLGLFAPALDRYGAAFVPTGSRMPVMFLLLAGTLPFCLADALLAPRLGWPLRLAARVLPLVTLLAAMLLSPRLGIAFTVLPVTLLFWCAYGLAARWVAVRAGSTAAGLALGLILAWALAASTPLVEA